MTWLRYREWDDRFNQVVARYVASPSDSHRLVVVGHGRRWLWSHHCQAPRAGWETLSQGECRKLGIARKLARAAYDLEVADQQEGRAA